MPKSLRICYEDKPDCSFRGTFSWPDERKTYIHLLLSAVSMERALLKETNGSWAPNSHWHSSLILSRAYGNLPYDFLRWTAKYSSRVNFQMSTWFFLHSLPTKPPQCKKKEAVYRQITIRVGWKCYNVHLCFGQAWITNSICLILYFHLLVAYPLQSTEWFLWRAQIAAYYC